MFPIDENSGSNKSMDKPLNKMMNLDKMEKVIKGKAALGLKKFKDFKEKVRIEAMEMEINKCDDNKRLKELHGGWALDKKQMQYLMTKPYIYNASAGSYLELLFLQRFWIWLSGFIPQSISPCVITAAGLVINILTSCAVLYYSPDARSEVQPWAFILCAIGVFLYQTLDALDGKQCYKVQNTQIEEVYDHGCDAVSTIFVTLAVSCAGQLGRSPVLLFTLFLSSMVAFFSSHWLCHVTRQMVFGKIDVSEGQWVMIIVHLLTGIYGQRIWHHKFNVFSYTIEASHMLAIVAILSVTRAIFNNLRMILGKKTPLEEYGVKIPRRTTNIWQPIFPIAILTSFAIISYSIGYFHVSPALFVFTFGFAFAKVTIKLVMMNCCNGEMEIWDTSLIAPLLLTINSRYLSLLHPKTALLCAFVYSLMDLSRYFTYASWDLRVALDLWIFSLKYPVGHPKNRKESGGHYINGLNNDKILNKSSTEGSTV